MSTHQSAIHESASGDCRLAVETCDRPLPPRIAAALAHLAEARRYAEEARRDAWDFAVEIRGLELGLNDLRWLVCRSYVEHRYETTRRGSRGRSFRTAADLAFSAASCFVIAPTGLAAIASRKRADADHADRGTGGPNANRGETRGLPFWDADRRELWAGSQLVKRYRTASPTQEAVLAAFQEESWPPSIDDPLPPHRGQDPKRRLHHTIRNLNRHQVNRVLHFGGDGTGTKVLWRYVDATAP